MKEDQVKFPTPETHATITVDGVNKTLEVDSGYLYGDIAIIGLVIGALIGAFYIPKLLGTEQYGVYNTVVAFVGLFTVFTFSGLTKVIIREATKDTSKTQEILEATIGLRNLFSIFAAILAIIVVLFINYEFGTKIYIAFYSLSLLFTAIGSSVKTVFQSHQKMKILGVMAIVKQLIQVPLSILFLSLGYGILSLITIHLLIEILVTILLFIPTQQMK